MSNNHTGDDMIERVCEKRVETKKEGDNETNNNNPSWGYVIGS